MSPNRLCRGCLVSGGGAATLQRVNRVLQKETMYRPLPSGQSLELQHEQHGMNQQGQRYAGNDCGGDELRDLA
jgi:hypothetical protein